MGIFDFLNNKKKEKARQEQLRLQEEKRRAEKAAADAAERKRQKKVDDAQLQVAADLQKMRKKYAPVHKSKKIKGYFDPTSTR